MVIVARQEQQFISFSAREVGYLLFGGSPFRWMNMARPFAKARPRSDDLAIAWVSDDDASKGRTVVCPFREDAAKQHSLKPGAIWCHHELSEVVDEEHRDLVVAYERIYSESYLATTHPDQFSETPSNTSPIR